LSAVKNRKKKLYDCHTYFMKPPAKDITPWQISASIP